MANADSYKRLAVEDIKAAMDTPVSNNNSHEVKTAETVSNRLFPVSFGSDGFDDTIGHLIKGYLPTESFGVVYGPSNSFKSFLAISLACHVAAFKSWNDRKVKREGLVIYIAGEGGPGITRRIKAWEDEYNSGTRLNNFCLIKQPVYLTEAASLQMLLDTIEKVSADKMLPPVLIVIDTLARCFAGADENSTRDMNQFIAACDRLKVRTGATVLAVHHTGKDIDKGARGSSALKAAADFEYEVSRPSEKVALILKATKVKDSTEPATQMFELNGRKLFIDEDGDDVTSLVLSNSGITLTEEDKPKGSNITNNHMAVWEAVRSRTQREETATRAVIRDDLLAIGFNKSTLNKSLGRWIQKLIDDGSLEERDGGLYPVVSQN